MKVSTAFGVLCLGALAALVMFAIWPIPSGRTVPVVAPSATWSEPVTIHMVAPSATPSGTPYETSCPCPARTWAP